MTGATSEQDQSVKSALRSSRRRSRDSLCLTVSVEEAARILGISRGAAYAHARDGSLPIVRLGKRLLVPRAVLEKLLTCA